MNNSPLVSIGVTTYDRYEMLIECLASILAQTYTNLEILISNDNVVEPISALKSELFSDPRVKIINQTTNLREICNMNWLLENSQGEYFTWLSDDDLLNPDFVRILVTALEANPRVPVAYSSYKSFENQTSDMQEVPSAMPCIKYQGKEFFSGYLTRAFSIIGCYGLFNRKQLLDVWGIKKLGVGFSPYSDTLLPLLFGTDSEYLYTVNNLVYLRTHGASASATSSDYFAYFTAQKDFLSYFNRLSKNIHPTVSDKIYQSLLEWFVTDLSAVIHRNANCKLTFKYVTMLRFTFLLVLEILHLTSRKIKVFAIYNKLLLTVSRPYISDLLKKW
jgi:glycosyltransferase involved in cell wall biosynthesis